MIVTTARRIACGALACAMAFAVANTAEARPQYNKAFKAAYEEKFEEGTSLKCNVCHGKSKKKLSQYGLDMKKAIGGKNVKDGDAITAALKKVADMPSKTEGKTYGELIEAGTLPAPFEE